MVLPVAKLKAKPKDEPEYPIHLHPLLPVLEPPEDLRSLDIGFTVNSFDIVGIPRARDTKLNHTSIIGYSDNGRYLRIAKQTGVKANVYADRPPIGWIDSKYSELSVLALRYSAVPKHWARTPLVNLTTEAGQSRLDHVKRYTEILEELSQQVGHYRYWFMLPSMHQLKKGNTSLYLTMEEEHEVVVASVLMRSL